jgi:hypothetical protein
MSKEDIKKYGTKFKPGQKINRLTTISYNKGYWECLCDCGNTTKVITHYLISGNTQSCGCLRKEKAKENIKSTFPINTKYEPRITSARRIWRSYCENDIDCTLTFEEWYNISQQNCFYCSSEPKNKHNGFISKKDSSEYAKDNGWFIYNGLDRIDNTKPHIIDNVVAACWNCNCYKRCLNLEDFYKQINNLKINTNKFECVDLLDLPKSYLLVSVKCAYRHYKRNFGEMGIDLRTFFTYSQLPCFYCGKEKSNYYNVYLKDKKATQIAKDNANFYYNGMDRIDNTKEHIIDNIVPACSTCNYGKGKLSLSEFYEWIIRIKEYQSNKNTI